MESYSTIILRVLLSYRFGKKKSVGTLSFCCDYGKFNKQLEKDNNPHRNVQDIIDQLAANKYFSTIDCVSTFWQLGR
jgi:hypothetical protein